jgi:hypothetical protein
MTEASVQAIAGWESFYVIVGSSGAALTGLQFVVITLVSDLRRRAAGGTELDAFATPTVVHFSVVLVIAAILSAPWPSVRGPDIAIGAIGVAGVVYTGIITRRARRATRYTPVLEDWIFHVILPFVGYGSALAASLLFMAHETLALFMIAGASLLFLVIGIHNAWDTVAWVTLEAAREERESHAAAEPRPPRDETQVELL